MKKYERNPNGQYYLPVEFTSSMSLSTHLIYIFLIIAFLFTAIYCFFNLTPKNILFPPIAIICGIYTLVQWIYYGVLKLGRLEIDDRELSFRTLTSNKRVPWEKVNEMGSKVIESGRYGNRNVFHIGLDEEFDELPFFRKILAKFGVTGISYGIPMNCFPEINQIKLMRTVNGIMESRYPHTEEANEYEEDVYPEDEI